MENTDQPISGEQKTGFWSWLIAVDQILRGQVTQPGRSVPSDIKFPIVGVSIVVVLMAVVYGFCMGVFSLIHGAETNEYSRALMQTFASMTKVPMLYVLTLVVTFPSLYVFNALIGSRLRILPVFKLLVASLAVNLAVLVSMGPILAFFSACTPNYPFIVLLNVLVFSIAGSLGLLFLLQTLNRLSTEFQPAASIDKMAPAGSPVQSAEIVEADLVSAGNKQPTSIEGPLDMPRGSGMSKHVGKVFACWVVVFGLVGAQMGWVLRPFIGSPELEFQWFRPRESNFFEAVAGAFWNLFA